MLSLDDIAPSFTLGGVAGGKTSGVEFALVALGAAALGWTAGKLFASVGAPLP